MVWRPDQLGEGNWIVQAVGWCVHVHHTHGPLPDRSHPGSGPWPGGWGLETPVLGDETRQHPVTKREDGGCAAMMVLRYGRNRDSKYLDFLVKYCERGRLFVSY